MKKNIKLTIALVAIEFKISGSKESNRWNGKLNRTYIRIMKKEYVNESFIPFDLDL